MPSPEFDVQERSDEELMQLLADGRISIQARQRACDQLVLRWYDHLKGYARRLFRGAAPAAGADLADDVVQEAFALVLQKAGTFDPGRRLAPWLRSVVHNLAVNLRRRESRYQGLGLEGEQLPGRELPPLDALASREVLARLSPDEHELFLAVYLRGEKVREVADRLGESQSKVYRTLQELRSRFRSALESGEMGAAASLPCSEKDR